MPSEKKHQEKSRLHTRNKNRERYDLNALMTCVPELKKHVMPNKYGAESINFSNPVAVKLLNKALLHHYYGVTYWDFPDENLCPPIPGRADYIHHIADLLGQNNNGIIPIDGQITCLDIGVGASCIYPIIGVTEYGWQFIGSDINSKSIESAQNIVNSNLSLKDRIECRLQKNAEYIFRGIIDKEDKIDLVICNPPFHSTIEDAQKGSRRKVKNLSGKKVKSPRLNFAGISMEIVYAGGEFEFIKNMIGESKAHAKNCFWFSTIISKQSNVNRIYRLLAQINAEFIQTIPLGTGNKSSRIVAWTFLSEAEKLTWGETRWKSPS